ncbi:hypothetical protein GCM10025874_15440 [Arenivirga flava]|uniref:Uncharacterized protein n=1 Tax=Arenivirga flava TaxID=1930060 RepID=A0AA37XB84_9MICO|nr:hypothetical protein GCM10025874_15440 [Arenivirga flava]
MQLDVGAEVVVAHAEASIAELAEAGGEGQDALALPVVGPQRRLTRGDRLDRLAQLHQSEQLLLAPGPREVPADEPQVEGVPRLARLHGQADPAPRVDDAHRFEHPHRLADHGA